MEWMWEVSEMNSQQEESGQSRKDWRKNKLWTSRNQEVYSVQVNANPFSRHPSRNVE